MINLIRVTLLCLLALAPLVRGEAMLQFFNASWEEITEKIPEIAEAGYESLWVPPPAKAGGGFSVGYDVFDRFDLGSKDQKGTVGTRYGTEAELLELIRVAHRFGIRVYLDNIMNHNGFEAPGFNEFVPLDVYPGFLPEDFHLRDQGDGTYRLWDNVRDWGDEWQVQQLGLSGLIDIAQEPGTTNLNFGLTEGSTAAKLEFLRHPDNPEYYCYVPTVPAVPGERHGDNEGTYVGFGPGNGITVSSLAADEDFYKEYVGEMLARSARWTLDHTKADGFRLDAVKHARADFFGATFGIDKDSSDYGYLGQSQRQFNLTRGFSDANHRDTVFNVDGGRDDAMMFGEHLGQPPSYGSYIDAGMRLIDNELRYNLNNILGNPSASLSGYDSSGTGGFAPGVAVMHAQSHDSGFAAERELQHALYFTREGLPLVYTDGYRQAEILEESGGAFPRHANTAFLGQFGDERLPNLAYIHQQFSRGSQAGRWGDADFIAYERIDKRENGGMSDEDGTVCLVMINDNQVAGQARNFFTAFPSDGGTSNDAYLYQYARGPGSQVGFYTYASNLSSVFVDASSYFVFSYRTPETASGWGDLGGKPIEIFQGGLPAATFSVTRTDGPDGDANFDGPNGNPGFHPYPDEVTDPTPGDYSYTVEIPRVTDASDLKFVLRADGSAANILCKLDGGIDLNGNPGGGSDPVDRDNPPALTNDMFLGYEQPTFVERSGAERFAATDTNRSTLGSDGSERWETVVGSGTFNRTDGTGSNPGAPNSVQFVYHDPVAALPATIGTGNHYQETVSGDLEIHVKTNDGLTGYEGILYYTTDGVTVPAGAAGKGLTPETSTVVMTEVGDAPDGGVGTWWKATISPKPTGTMRYLAGIRRTTAAGATINPVFPSGASEVADKRDMMTVFEIAGFDGTSVVHFPHNDYQKTPDQTGFVTETGLEEGFHILRTRAFLERSGKASLYNTFQQTFYYDAARPQGEIAFPTESQTLEGQNYGCVVRADSSTSEVWFFVDDGVGINDDVSTGAQNGNGPGKWVRAVEAGPDPNITSVYPKEFRFNYTNIASGSVPAVLQVRLVEATSSDSSTWTSTVSPADDANGWYTTLTRNVVANGVPRQLFVAFPANDGDIVNDSYTVKAYITKALGDGLTEAQFLDQFEVRVASQQSGSPDGAVLQDPALLSISYNETAEYHALAFDVPPLYNGDPNFLHWIEVRHESGSIEILATRQVRAEVVENSYVSIIQPPLSGPDGSPYEEVLPDLANPAPEDREVLIRIETNPEINDVQLAFSPAVGTVTLDQVEAVGSVKYWDFIWGGVVPGTYFFQADGYFTVGGTLADQSPLWAVKVVLGPAVPVDQDNDFDTLPDYWELAQGLDPGDDGSTDPDQGANGDPDEDGLANFMEFLVGLNPLVADAGDYPVLTIQGEADGSMTLEFPSIPDRLYRAFWSSDLGTWNQMGGDLSTVGQTAGVLSVPDTGLPDTPTHPNVTDERYYRFEITLP